jgi:DNA-binding NarL/FixJ family response regulator
MVDDHAIVREGLKRILASESDLEVAAEAGCVTEALKLLRQQSFNLVLLDISLPGRSGLELLRIIRDEFQKLPALVLSIYPEDQYALRVLRQCAGGYLTKETAPERLVEAIRKVASGRKYVSPEMAERLAMAVGETEGTPHERLSDREFEIFRLIGSGKGLTEIGEQLHISVKTVSTYRSRILEKTRFQNNAEIIHYVILNNLLPLSS